VSARTTAGSGAEGAAALFARDPLAQHLGMRVEAAGSGTATVAMTVRPEMLNGHGICHGGMTFALADTAFAYACNSDGQAAVAMAADIAFTAPARLGERLIATASRRSEEGRTGIYDVEVRTAEGRLIALFRGTSRQIRTGEAGPSR
jgi:acyl-CoA thioesterase